MQGFKVHKFLHILHFRSAFCVVVGGGGDILFVAAMAAAVAVPTGHFMAEICQLDLMFHT